MILAADPQNANIRMNLGSLDSTFGHALVRAGHRTEGLLLQRQGLSMLKKVCDEDPDNAAARKEKSDAEGRLAGSDDG